MPRNTRPRKRTHLRNGEAITNVRTETPEHMARSLVDRGLASVLILDSPLHQASPMRREREV